MNVLRSKLTTVALVALALWLGVVSLDAWVVGQPVRDELAGLEGKIKSAEDDHERLTRFIGLADSPSFLEKQARQNLNYKNPGEKVVFVYSELGTLASASADGSAGGANAPNYVKWWRYILGR